MPSGVHAQSREQLEKDLADLENQIKQLQGTITQTQAQKNSLSKDISLLSQKISQSKLKIQAHNKAISKLSENIAQKNSTIGELNAKVDREKESMSQIMRKTKYLDEYSLVTFGLQSKSLSTFFEDMDSFNRVAKNTQRRRSR
jgi:chromosome segregation ATPase